MHEEENKLAPFFRRSPVDEFAEKMIEQEEMSHKSPVTEQPHFVPGTPTETPHPQGE